MADPLEQAEAKASPPPSERDPFGSRHKLANLAMIVRGFEDEEPAPYKLGVHATYALALGFLFVGDAIGSLVAEARQAREHLAAIRVNTARRGPKPSNSNG